MVTRQEKMIMIKNQKAEMTAAKSKPKKATTKKTEEKKEEPKSE